MCFDSKQKYFPRNYPRTLDITWRGYLNDLIRLGALFSRPNAFVIHRTKVTERQKEKQLNEANFYWSILISFK
jgi:hypothetical protein